MSVNQQISLSQAAQEGGLHILPGLYPGNSSAPRQYITYKPPNTDRLRFFALHSANPHPDAQHATPLPGYSASNHLQRLYDQYLAGGDNKHPESHLEGTLVLINTVQRVRRRVDLLGKDVGSAMPPMDDAGTGAIGSGVAQRSATTSVKRLDAFSKLVDTFAQLLKFRSWESLIHVGSCAIGKPSQSLDRDIR